MKDNNSFSYLMKITFHQNEIKRKKFNKLVIKMQNRLQRINQENSQLLLEVESKLNFLVKG